MSDSAAYQSLENRFGAAGKLKATRALLFWDSQTYMPSGSAWSRGEQIAVLEETIADLTSAESTGELIEIAEASADALGAVQRANLREMRRIWAHGAAVPKELLSERARLTQSLTAAWLEAKRTNDFALFVPGFEAMMAIHREIGAAKSEALGMTSYDTFMDEIDPGLTTALVDPIFDDLQFSLPELLDEVVERQSGWSEPIQFGGDRSVDRQRALSLDLAKAIGHVAEHCRIDVAPHPFALVTVPADVRFTTAFDVDDATKSIMGTIHESGHAMYEMNLPRALAFQPAGSARGTTVHESQSLMLEMQAGRSREFLRFLGSAMAEEFGGDPAAYRSANLLNTYRRVGVGFSRVDADEISYPLHVILRYRLEQDLLSGNLQVRDLPQAWSELSKQLFGRSPPDDSRGCLQDIHWAVGLFGYFPSYALGAALAAQLFERANADDPTILPRLEYGDFGPYFGWVRAHVHQRASLVSFALLVKEATGEALSADALKRHLRRRYVDEPAE